MNLRNGQFTQSPSKFCVVGCKNSEHARAFNLVVFRQLKLIFCCWYLHSRIKNVLVVLLSVKAWTFFLWTNGCLYRCTELNWYDFMKRLWNDLPLQPIPWSCFPMSLYLFTAPRLPDIEIVFDTNETPCIRHLLSPLGWRSPLRSSEHPFSLVKCECAMTNRKKSIQNRFKNPEIFIWSLKATKAKEGGQNSSVRLTLIERGLYKKALWKKNI